MADIVERLEDEARFGWHIAANRQADTRDLHTEAANAIKSLRSTNARLSEALRPFAAGFPNTDRRDYERAAFTLTTPSTGKG